MKIIIETNMPTAGYVTFTGNEVAIMVELAAENIKATMGEESAYTMSAPLFKRDGNPISAHWTVEL